MTKYKFLCIDIGTTSLKAALVSDDGQVLSFSQVPFNSLNENHRISDDWILALKKSIVEIKQNCEQFVDEKNCIKQSGALDVDAICISGNGPTIVSDDGTTFLWNENLKFTNQKDFAPSLFLPRLNEFKNLFAKQFKTQKIFSCPEFLIYKLCDAHITILPESRYEKAYWSERDILNLGTNVKQFGKFVAPGIIVGRVTDSASKEFNLKINTPIVTGGPDFIVALIGTNTLKPGKICDCAGSSEGINLCIDRPIFYDGLRTLPSVMSGLWNLATLLPSSGRQFVECKKAREKKLCVTLSYDEYIFHCANHKESKGYKTMENLAHQIDAGIKNLLQCAKENNLPVDDFMAVTGGQAKNNWWMQLKSNITNSKYAVLQTCDSELIGDAVLCSVALGLSDSIQSAAEKIVKLKKIYEPEK